jgi:hypothetical protein
MQMDTNGTLQHQTNYTKGCSAVILDVPIEEGDTVSLPSYDGLKFTITKHGFGNRIVSDISHDYTFSAQDAEDYATIIVAHINKDYFTDEEIAWVNENAIITKALNGGD